MVCGHSLPEVFKEQDRIQSFVHGKEPEKNFGHVSSTKKKTKEAKK
jgi:ferredoxin